MLFSRHAMAACAFAGILATSGSASARAENDPASASASLEPIDAFKPATATPANDDRDPSPARLARPRLDAKRFVVARDFGIAVPVGQLADRAAAMYGPLVRLGWHPSDRVELGLRAAYQRGFDRTIGGATGSLSTVPIYASARWFALGHRSGPYVGVELGVNVFRQSFEARTSFLDVSADKTWVRPAGDVGVGWVWSRALPIDVRAQLASLDLVSKHGPLDDLAFGVTAGYSIFF